jgi:hypothetical protein
MRCMVCGGEMRLVQTVPDETMTVPGFEHHTLNCPSCHDEERRLVFIRQPEPLSPPIQDPQFLYATLQPVAGTAAADTASQVSSGVRSEAMLPIESTRLPLASPAYRPSISRKPRSANSRVWDRATALHHGRWRALCDRLGLRVAGEKADASRKG